MSERPTHLVNLLLGIQHHICELRDAGQHTAEDLRTSILQLAAARKLQVVETPCLARKLP